MTKLAKRISLFERQFGQNSARCDGVYPPLTPCCAMLASGNTKYQVTFRHRLGSGEGGGREKVYSFGHFERHVSD